VDLSSLVECQLKQWQGGTTLFVNGNRRTCSANPCQRGSYKFAFLMELSCVSAQNLIVATPKHIYS